MSATSTSNISKNTILCHACAEDVLDEYIPCQGFCNAVFHPDCSGVKPALLKEIASHRQIFWVCKSCTNLMVDLRHRRSIQCAYEAGQELSLSHHNRIVEQLKSELLTVLKAELSANFAKLVASNSLTPRSSSLNKGGFRGSGSRRLFDNNPAPPPGPNPIPPKPVTGKPGGPTDVPERIVANGFGAPAGDDSPRFWLYLSRVSRNVTEEQITKLAIDRLGVSEIKAKRLVAKGKDVSRMRFISFKVGMNFDLKDKALESTTWPDGLLVQSSATCPTTRSNEYANAEVYARIHAAGVKGNGDKSEGYRANFTSEPGLFTYGSLNKLTRTSVPGPALNRRHLQQPNGPLSFITVYYQNAGGIRTKTKQFYLALASSDYDVIALSETWLQDDIVDAELSSNYHLFRQDRSALTSDRRRGGGVLVAVKKSHEVTCTRVLSRGYEYLEQVAVRVKVRNHIVYVCCIYIRPNGPPEVYASHGTAVQELLDLSTHDDSIIVTGDYNLPHLSWTFDDDVNGFIPLNASSEQELALTENVVATGLLQICSLMNANGRILDLAFVNDAHSVELIEPPSSILRTDRHHKPFVLRVDFLDVPDEATGNYEMEPDFRRCDFDLAAEALSIIDWDAILLDRDTNAATTILYDVLYEIVRQFVPVRRIPCNRTEKLPWWNADLRNRRNILRKARKKLFRASTPENRATVEHLEAEYESLQDSSFREYLNRVQVDLKENPSSFWRYVRSRKRSSVLPARISFNNTTAENPADAANIFADFFSNVYETTAPAASADYLNTLPTHDLQYSQPEFSQVDVQTALDVVDPSKGAGPDRLPPAFIKRLSAQLAKPVSIIFNRSLSEGVFPDEWKLAAITPIHKSGSTMAADNYRPISILSCLPKVFEVLIHEGMYSAAQFPLAQIGLWTRQVTDKIKACVVADCPGSFSLRLSPDPQGRLLSRQPLTAAVRDRRHASTLSEGRFGSWIFLAESDDTESLAGGTRVAGGRELTARGGWTRSGGRDARPREG
ncbi:hypothetical protein pipiens_015226 [Culex pipiens pipiens]|uniref:Endonuclease/exonuclease/phosphatase domain-containing protein n=1 Tax=Culex pipiens pipiens TaxID=38569 RepID=A0ABD1CRF2_CULPP